MCVIIVKDNDKTIESSILVKSSLINPDGLGVIWLDDWTIDRYNSNDYDVLNTSRPFIAHFRYATVGKVCIENTHPFTINNKEVLMQNGSLKGLGSKDMVDGDELAKILSHVPKQYWAKILELTDNRFLTANVVDKTYDLYNADQWVEHKGSMYSKKNVLGGNLVAVYGTLKKGHSNFNNYLDYNNFISSGVTLEKYPFIVEGLPYVSSNKGYGHNVEVDVMLVDDDELFELDCLESHPNWYERKEVQIHTEDHGVVTAWLYFNDTVDYTDKELLSTYLEESRYSYNDWDGWDSKGGDVVNGDCCGECGSKHVEFDEFEFANYCWECEGYSESKTYLQYDNSFIKY
jgi:gamma-glutamylcyclotransferase (GGCT)/AIG2-like uncharacterized protein YtfP